MKTYDLYVGVLNINLNSKIIGKYRVLVKGNLDSGKLKDVLTGKKYRLEPKNSYILGTYIDKESICSFNLLTGNKGKNLNKQKILSLYDDIVLGDQDKYL
ncbi:MAG: hypothetical protein Q4E75_04215 [bacterium]|nr:hypothetical protein [bacterium]